MRLLTTSELLQRLNYQIVFLRMDVRNRNDIDPLSVESFQQTHDALVESLTRHVNAVTAALVGAADTNLEIRKDEL